LSKAQFCILAKYGTSHPRRLLEGYQFWTLVIAGSRKLSQIFGTAHFSAMLAEIQENESIAD
jgi:hypothetical protein